MAFAITVPRLGWTMEEGVFLGWLKNDGDTIKAGEPIFTLESEKAAQEVEATEPGILRIHPAGPEAGSVVLVGALIGYLAGAGEAVAFDNPAAAPARQAVTSKPAPTSSSTGVPPVSSAAMTGKTLARNVPILTISPRAARTAAALAVDWTTVRGTGRTGRIRERDVLAAASGPAHPIAEAPRVLIDPALSGRTAPLTSTRRTIARRMAAGVHEAAPVTLTARADATSLVAARARMKSESPAGEPIPTLNDIFVKLIAAALQQHPALTAQWRGDTIFFPEAVNISIAIDTDDGLVAPVIRDVPAKSVEEIAQSSRLLIEHARDGALSPEELRGGVFTVTNLGSLGIEFFTPIINLPQCAILGIGRIKREPVFVESRISAREIVPLSLTFDHRIVDGAPAARFLGTVVQLIETPAPYIRAQQS